MTLKEEITKAIKDNTKWVGMEYERDFKTDIPAGAESVLDILEREAALFAEWKETNSFKGWHKGEKHTTSELFTLYKTTQNG